MATICDRYLEPSTLFLTRFQQISNILSSSTKRILMLLLQTDYPTDSKLNLHLELVIFKTHLMLSVCGSVAPRGAAKLMGPGTPVAFIGLSATGKQIDLRQ